MQTVRVGGYHIGVRASTEPAHEALQEILRSLHVEDAAPPNYSMQLSPASARGPAHFHRLLRACTVVRRSRNAGDILDEFLARMDEIALKDDASVVRLQASAFVREGYAVLVPAWMEPHLDRRAQQLRKFGFTRVAGSVANLDVDTGALDVRPPSIDLDAEALDRWRPRLDSGTGPGVVAPVGRYRIAAWAFADRAGEDVIPSASAAILRALTVVANGAVVGRQVAIETVAKVLDHARVALLPPSNVDVGQFIEKILG